MPHLSWISNLKLYHFKLHRLLNLRGVLLHINTLLKKSNINQSNLNSLQICYVIRFSNYVSSHSCIAAPFRFKSVLVHKMQKSFAKYFNMTFMIGEKKYWLSILHKLIWFGMAKFCSVAQYWISIHVSKVLCKQFIWLTN